MKETNKTFEDIKHVDKNGNEYWEARELQIVFEYKEWRKFELVIYKAKDACNNSDVDTNKQFVHTDKLSINVNKGKRTIPDYKLTRYACYLIAQNGDSRKEVIALAQTYFAIQTRKQELIEKEYRELSEDEKRLYQRNLTRKGNNSLNIAAKNAGVKSFDKFHNAGYKGLYNGETANDIAKRKNLRYREDILDNMGSAELAAKNKLLSNHKLNLPDMIPNPIVIKVNDTIGIIVCKKKNQYVIDYCSDDRILSREYELIAK